LKFRRWHAAANVLSALPKSVHAAARRALAEITGAEDNAHAKAAVKAFSDAFGVKWPKAVEKVTANEEALLAFWTSCCGAPKAAGGRTPRTSWRSCARGGL
jgi:transposase-like protein